MSENAHRYGDGGRALRHLTAARVGVREGLRAYRDEFALAPSASGFKQALGPAMQIGGFTSPIELSLLYHLTLLQAVSGVVVEIGCFLGRSTVILARASIEADGQAVVAVDPHEDRLGLQAGVSSMKDGFLSNLEAGGVAQQVEYVQATAVLAAERWDRRPVSLLFVDGRHMREDVLADVQAWAPWLAPGACVVFDDYLTAPGVRSAVRALRASCVVPGAALVVGKMIAFGPQTLMRDVPAPPASRLLARLGDRTLDRFNRIFRDSSVLSRSPEPLR